MQGSEGMTGIAVVARGLGGGEGIEDSTQCYRLKAISPRQPANKF
jgi:hypothetical protein